MIKIIAHLCQLYFFLRVSGITENILAAEWNVKEPSQKNIAYITLNSV